MQNGPEFSWHNSTAEVLKSVDVYWFISAVQKLRQKHRFQLAEFWRCCLELALQLKFFSVNFTQQGKEVDKTVECEAHPVQLICNSKEHYLVVFPESGLPAFYNDR